jgi:monoterpene epsilon-lactone hydrolase
MNTADNGALMAALRERLTKWFLMRFLHQARRSLARDPSPARMRLDMERFERRMLRHGIDPLAAPIDLGHFTAGWVVPEARDEGRIILYLHGGGFIAESPKLHGKLLERMARKAGGRGFYVSYRLAPEHPYPAGTDDCLAAYRYLLAEGIDPARIVIAGDSAGGNLTLVTAMRARDSGLPLPAALVMMSPVLDSGFSGDSVRRNDGLDPLFRSSVLEAFAGYYVPVERRQEPYVSPLAGDLAGLPPMLVLVGSSEILLDDSVRLACRADNVDLQVWHAMPHVFPAMPGLAEAGQAIDVMAGFIRAHVASSANTATPLRGG